MRSNLSRSHVRSSTCNCNQCQSNPTPRPPTTTLAMFRLTFTPIIFNNNSNNNSSSSILPTLTLRWYRRINLCLTRTGWVGMWCPHRHSSTTPSCSSVKSNRTCSSCPTTSSSSSDWMKSFCSRPCWSGTPSSCFNTTYNFSKSRSSSCFNSSNSSSITCLSCTWSTALMRRRRWWWESLKRIWRANLCPRLIIRLHLAPRPPPRRLYLQFLPAIRPFWIIPLAAAAAVVATHLTIPWSRWTPMKHLTSFWIITF